MIKQYNEVLECLKTKHGRNFRQSTKKVLENLDHFQGNPSWISSEGARFPIIIKEVGRSSYERGKFLVEFANCKSVIISVTPAKEHDNFLCGGKKIGIFPAVRGLGKYKNKLMEKVSISSHYFIDYIKIVNNTVVDYCQGYEKDTSADWVPNTHDESLDWSILRNEREEVYNTQN